MSGAAEGRGLTPAAWRGIGTLLCAAGVVVALLGAGRLERAGAVWHSRPLWPLFAVGITLLCVAVALLRHPGAAVVAGAAAADRTEALLADDEVVRALLSGQGSAAAGAGALPAALEVLAGAAAPTEDAPYLLWLKLQLDPLLDDLLPRLFAGREAFRGRRGVRAYGALFTGLARAERLLARAWSAAVDGYAEEARRALADAARQIEESAQLAGRPPAA